MDESEGTTERHTCPEAGCTKSFGRRERLEIHIRSHTKERPFKCIIDGCHKSYARMQHLSRHVQTWHCTMAEKEACRVKCPVCGQTIANSQVLLVHMKVHEKEEKATESYKCPEEGCEEKFHKKKQLVVHRLQHAGNLPTAMRCHKCPYDGCGKTFVFPNKLRRHMKIHQGYPCDVDGCSEVLATWSARRKHKAQQHPPDLTCKECGVTLTTKTNLRQHLNVHQPSRQTIMCQEEGCGRTFLHEKNMRQHVRAVHRGEAIWQGREKTAAAKKERKTVKSRSAAACWLFLDDRGEEVKVYRQAPPETREMFRKETEAANLATRPSCDTSESPSSDEDCGFCDKLEPVGSPGSSCSEKPTPSNEEALVCTSASGTSQESELMPSRVKELEAPLIDLPISAGGSVKSESMCSPVQSHVEKLHPSQTVNSSSDADPQKSVRSEEMDFYVVRQILHKYVKRC